MGSRSDIEKSYIAGFLDGDGSIMLQLKKRSDTSRGYRFMATICLYQDSRHDTWLYWIRDILSAGYVTNRNDGISELRVNGFATIRRILTDLQPFIRFKQASSRSDDNGLSFTGTWFREAFGAGNSHSNRPDAGHPAGKLQGS